MEIQLFKQCFQWFIICSRIVAIKVRIPGLLASRCQALLIMATQTRRTKKKAKALPSSKRVLILRNLKPSKGEERKPRNSRLSCRN